MALKTYHVIFVLSRVLTQYFGVMGCFDKFYTDLRVDQQKHRRLLHVLCLSEIPCLQETKDWPIPFSVTKKIRKQIWNWVVSWEFLLTTLFSLFAARGVSFPVLLFNKISLQRSLCSWLTLWTPFALHNVTDALLKWLYEIILRKIIIRILLFEAYSTLLSKTQLPYISYHFNELIIVHDICVVAIKTGKTWHAVTAKRSSQWAECSNKELTNYESHVTQHVTKHYPNIIKTLELCYRISSLLSFRK